MTGTALEARLRAAIREVPDFPKPGIGFKDITPILIDPPLFHDTLDALAAWAKGKRADKIVGVDARGFLFAAPVADRLGIGLVPVRKTGKLPHETRSESYDLEYGTSTLQVHVDAIAQGERVIVVDDLLATGGTVAAATRLARGLGGDVAGAAFVVELGFLGGRALLDGVDCMSLVRFD